jgi:hypothetical protein
MSEELTHALPKGAISLIQVVVVVLVKIISYINIREPIPVEIRYAQPQPIGVDPAVQACLFADIGKPALVVSEQSVPGYLCRK